MALQEFLSTNKLNTTTQLSVGSNTGTAAYLFNRYHKLGYVTSGFNSTSATVISVSFTAATVITNVMLQNHNLKDFRVYYDGVTANSLLATTTNSATSTYLTFSSITVSSIQVQMNNTIQGSVEKRVGELVIAERKLQFERNPSIVDFEPIYKRKQVVHEMPDGGAVVFNIRDKYQAKLGWKFITSTFRDSLFTLFDSQVSLYYVPKPTTTSWDGQAFEVNWIGDFNFKPSSNVETSGYSGNLLIRQTTSG